MEDLVRRAQRGDTGALAGLLDELLPYVGRICAAVDLDHAEDATQEAMIAVLRNITALREPVALRSWVRRIAVNAAIRTATRRGRSAPTVAVDPDRLIDSTAVPDSATAVEVRAILAALPPQQRAVLVLRHVDDLSDAEIADVLALPTGTVKSRLHRARAAFRERWTA